MKYNPTIKTKFIPLVKQAVVPNHGTAACFYSTKSERFHQRGNCPAISKNVEKNLSLTKKTKEQENRAEYPLSLVIMLEGKFKTSIPRG